GSFTSAQAVPTTTATSGAGIRYTADNTEPGFSSPIYSAPVPVNATTVLKARAFARSMTPSSAAGGLYLIDLGTVDRPRFSPGAGTYVTQRPVTISSETPGAVIHYRVDGLVPDETDPTV